MNSPGPESHTQISGGKQIKRAKFKTQSVTQPEIRAESITELQEQREHQEEMPDTMLTQEYGGSQLR